MDLPTPPLVLLEDLISTLLAGFSRVYKTLVIVGSAPHWYRDQRDKERLLSTNNERNVVTLATTFLERIL